MNKPEILLIDDDEVFCANLKKYFSQAQLSVSVITDPTVADAIDFSKYALLLLDLDMPLVHGSEIIKKIPNKRRPVVVIVSGHNDLETRMQLLESGADFFLSKPVELGEICLIAKRAIGRASDKADDQTSTWVLHRAQYALSTPCGEKFGLTSAEYRLLERLFLSSPEVVPKEELAHAFSGDRGRVNIDFHRSLEVIISRLRSRLNSDFGAFPVKALRNVGYVFHGNCKIVE